MTILVTGGTGNLGRPTVELLRAAGHDVRVLSRKPGPGRVVGDLSAGSGIRDALTGVDTVVHLATTRWKDAGQTRTLLHAARAAGIRHLIFMSIVGVDRIPYAYYRDKVASERLIEDSGVPFTILRATQFHDFVDGYFRAQRRLPVVFALDILDQPIAVHEVAERLTELAGAVPAGRAQDIGGPEQLSLRALGETWQRAHGSNKKVRLLRLGGKTIRAFRAGHHLTPLPGYGRETFADYAARQASAGVEQ
jgi:uncharacterized protein YbjT (DUF2867 family)